MSDDPESEFDPEGGSNSHAAPLQGFLPSPYLNTLILRLFPTTTPKDVLIRFALFAIGFSPIASVCLSTFRLIPLHVSGPLVVLPAIFAAVWICRTYEAYAPRVLEGLASGIIAVTLYDMTRIPFVAAGLWFDFIPKIGTYLLNAQDPNYSVLHWSVGYIWRYVGNGGGMGLAFYMVLPLLKIRLDPRLTGTLYGLGIFACLLVTIYLSPAGRIYLFDPSLMTGALGLVGHIVYGFILGACAHFLSPELAHNRRRSYIFDPKLQFTACALTFAAVLALCLIHLVSFHNFVERMLRTLALSPDSPELKAVYLARRTFLTTTAITELFFAIAIAMVTLYFTYRVSGPIYRLRRLLREIAGGKLPERFRVRRGDLFEKELPADVERALEILRKHWRP